MMSAPLPEGESTPPGAEDVGARTRNSQTFVTASGERVLRGYPGPVH